MHLAGFKYAGVSVSRPLHTYDQNVTGTVRLLEAMAAHGVRRFVFSSSAAVYGTPDDDLVTEDTPTRPESPYGESKLIGEWLLRGPGAGAADAERRSGTPRCATSTWSAPATRDLHDTSPHNLFPLVLDAAGRGPDAADQRHRLPDPGRHLRPRLRARRRPGRLPRRRRPGARWPAQPLEPVYNLGSGTGSRSGEIMDAIARATGIDFTPEVRARRPGDPARIVASGELAARDLDWKMRHTVDEMVATAWAARQAALLA